MQKHALVIDNDFFFVEFLSDILEKRGYVVSKAYDGKGGITRLREVHVDLLFVDLIMPKIDGTQVIQFTRKQFTGHRFPIVAISGSMIERNEDIQKIGADYYITKGPIETMADHISSFLDKLEKQTISASDEIIGTTRLFPQQSTVEMLEVMDFQEGIFDSIGLGLFVIDRDEQIIRANDLGIAMINKSMEAMLNRHVTSLLPESKKTKLISALKSVARNRNIKSTSFEVATDELHLRVIVSIHRIGQAAIGWIIAMEDMRQWEEPV
ncbi:MAG: response regulator [Deltaproteobacteria bacterium]|nr:response regulator [Deltaproteobacteria bacterium]